MSTSKAARCQKLWSKHGGQGGARAVSWGAGCQAVYSIFFGSLLRGGAEINIHITALGRTDRLQSSSVGYPRAPLKATSSFFVWKGVLSGIFLFEAPHSPPQSYIHGSTCSHQVTCSPRGGSRSQLQSTFYHGPYPSHHPSALGEFPRCLVTSAQLLQVVPSLGHR